jgi:hypothetical protein
MIRPFRRSAWWLRAWLTVWRLWIFHHKEYLDIRRAVLARREARAAEGD